MDSPCRDSGPRPCRDIVGCKRSPAHPSQIPFFFLGRTHHKAPTPIHPPAPDKATRNIKPSSSWARTDMPCTHVGQSHLRPPSVPRAGERAGGRTDGRTDGRVGRSVGRTDGRADGRTDGRTDERTDGRTNGRPMFRTGRSKHLPPPQCLERAVLNILDWVTLGFRTPWAGEGAAENKKTKQVFA